jgi:hypothetical protein
MKKKKIIKPEHQHPFVCYMSIEESHAFLEDYLEGQLSDEEIYKKYDLEDLIGEEPLHYLVPEFKIEGSVCPTCKRTYGYRVTENREIKRCICGHCEEPEISEEMQGFWDFLTRKHNI